jgi:hypothetical protein
METLTFLSRSICALRGTPTRFKNPPGPALLCLCFFLGVVSLFPLGSREEAAPETLDTTWTLMITDFDTSALGEINSALGQSVLRDLAMEIGKVNYRLRVADEYAYYETLAERQNLAAAAQALTAKRSERDQLLYRGDPKWRYRRNLKAVDLQIKELEEEFLKVQASEVLIEREPVFSLSSENMEGFFPPPPGEGEEYQFCKTRKADAIITGSMSEYHGRIFVTQNLYVLYADSYTYRDSTIFSPERSAEAMAEFANRITLAIAGLPPAELRVSVMPENALVLLDRGYGGRGSLEQSLPPGNVRLEVFAEGHESADIELELEGGEWTELTLELKPEDQTSVIVDTPGKEGSSIYLGSLFMGKTPLTLSLPNNELEYIFAETPDGEEAEAVFLSPPPQYLPPPVTSAWRPRLFAGVFSRRSDLDGNRLSLRTVEPYDPGEGRVDRARKWYYWAWGGTWVSAIGAWMINGYANSMVNAYNNSPFPSPEMYDKAKRGQTLNFVGIGLVSAAVVVEIVQMARYIIISGKDAPPYVD